MTKRFQNKEISKDLYLQYAKDWALIIQSIGGYPTLPYDEKTNEIQYKFIAEVQLSKKIIFERILEWSAINFGSLDKVLKYKNIDSGKIILKGYSSITHKKDVRNFWGDLKEYDSNTEAYQTYIFTIKDNKYKVEVLNMGFKFSSSGYVLNGVYIPNRATENPIKLIYPVTNYKSEEWKEKLDLLKHNDNSIKSLVTNLEKYIINFEADYKF